MYLGFLVPPVLSCFFDPDSRVRYYACEALYNIAKVARETILPFFNDIFDGLSKVSYNSKFIREFFLVYACFCVYLCRAVMLRNLRYMMNNMGEQSGVCQLK